MANRSKRTSKKEQDFLLMLREGASVARAAEAVGVGRRTVYEWRAADEEFLAKWEDAVEHGTDLLEDEAIKRARSGSDTLLIFLLKARRPEKYKDRIHSELTGPDGGPLQVQTVERKVIDPAN